MAQAVQITKQEFEDFLFPQGGFQLLQLEGTTELVYAKLVRQGDKAYSLRIYSSINPTGDSRGVGEDAIRVNCWVKMQFDGETKIFKAGGSKRVHRVMGWRANLQNRIDHWHECIGPVCPECGAPTLKRTPKKGQTWKPFFGCCRFPVCRGKA